MNKSKNADWTNDLGVARSLTRRYIIALSLIATLASSAWISLHLVISAQKNTAAIVNVSGRQRMLSQRTALFANLLVNLPASERPLIRVKLKEAIDLMARSHNGLINGDNEMGLPNTMSSTVRSMYFDGPGSLNEQVDTYIRNVDALLLLNDGELTKDNAQLDYITKVAPTTLVISLDNMVHQYQMEGEASISRLQEAETIFWIATLLLLILEAMLIFHPFVKHVGVIIGRLKRVTEELKLHQGYFEEMLKQRTEELEIRSKELIESESLFRAIFNQSSSGIELIDPQTLKFVETNPAACSMLGYTHEESLQLYLTDTQADLSEEELKAAVQKVDESGGLTMENRHRCKDGKILDVEIFARMLDLPGKRLLVGIWQDITQRKRAEENLHIIASVFENSQEAIVITDSNNTYLDVNPAFTRITGYSREEAIGKTPKLLSSGKHDKAYFEEMWRSLKQKGVWRDEIWNRRKSGEIFAELLSISVICDDEGRVQRYVGVFSDISHIKEHEAELSRIAHYDALTGIPNRVMLADRMRQAIAHTVREKNMMTVCYLDLDGFKSINDSMGHEAGDQVLVEVARRIENTIRGADTVARLGGDEFVVVLLGQQKGEEYLATLDRLLSSISKPILIKEKKFTLSASIGVSVFPLDDSDADTLLRHADQAMYIAKQSGKNRFHIYDPELDIRARIQHEHLKGIRQGLEQGQFVLYYQPKIDLKTKKLSGVEALIRWNHPERGLLLPVEFMNTMGGSDIDIEIGEWVILTALEQIERWRNSGLNIDVSINISAQHLESAEFTKKLKQQLERFPEIKQGRLQIEVLETAALNDLVVVRSIIEECRKFGVGFALDDFGTGYSSLSYLNSLPVDVLKIDQSFVRDMLRDKSDMLIVRGIIALAKSFSLQTVAEGIETDAHYQALLEMGCEFGQGYGIANPMPADDLVNWQFARG